MPAPRILPNHLLLRPGRGIPLDRLRPVIVHGGRPIKPRMGIRRIDADDGNGPALVVPTDLRPFAGDRQARLQVWADGFKLSDTALFATGGVVSGEIERVADHCLTGWAAHALGERLPAGELWVDGVPSGRFKADIGRRDLGGVGPLASCAGFVVPLPARALDGHEHELSVTFDQSRMSPIRMRAKPRFRLERTTTTSVKLWFYDAGQPDGPVTITLRDEAGEVLVSGPTYPRADTGERLGRWHTGYEADMPLDLAPGRIEICAGRNAAMVFATLEVATAAARIDAMREGAGALLRLEREHGGPVGWSRDVLAELRRQSRLPSASAAEIRRATGSLGRGISIVVPIYAGVEETAACLASLRRAVEAGDDDIAEIFLIDDRSPEPAMATLLAAQRSPIGECVIRVVHNADNLGFVATANRGITLADADHDVILLNSDTVVPIGFAARLKAAAHADARIASATPLSNDATVLSVPRVDHRNAIPAVDAAELDMLLQARGGPTSVDVPVGVGFCLYMKREAIDDVGRLDPLWGRGYCEEVDWCLIARDRGWTHVAALDTYVHHASSVSFGTVERTRLLAANQLMLDAKYPEFIPQVRAFLAKDPMAAVRLDVFCHLLARAGKPCLIHVTHAMGGGTGVLIERYAAAHAAAGGVNLVCSSVHDRWLGVTMNDISWREGGLALRLPEGAMAAFLDRLEALGLPGLRAIVHSLSGAADVVRGLGVIWSIPYAVCLHDYQAICPRVTLVDQTNLFCGVPSLRYCQLCVRSNEIYDFGPAGDRLIEQDMPAWIAANRALLERAVAVVAPSADTATRVADRLGLGNIRVLPHPETVERAVIRPSPGGETTRIAIVGGINLAKGMLVLRDLAHHIDETGAAVRLKLFGEVSEPSEFGRQGALDIVGRYKPADLPALLDAWNPHFVFFPAVWPETYCFVLSEIWAAGYPAVGFDLGAIAERIRATGGGVVLPFVPDAASLLPTLLAARAAVAQLGGHAIDIGSPWDRDDPTLSRVFGADQVLRVAS